MNENINPLKITTAFRISDISKLDSRKVKTLTEALLLRQLYSSLVEYDINGQLVSGVCEYFEWINNELIFTFNDKVILNNGRKLDANDALISIKRIMMDNSNLHGNLKQMICPDFIFKNLNDHCENIIVKDKKLIIKTVHHKYQKWLLPILASIDFRIIPVESIDPISLNIINFKLTTGPYFLNEESVDKIYLNSNSKHYHFNLKMPQIIEILKITNEDVFTLFKNKKIDLIPTTESIKVLQYQDLIKSKIEFNEFTTNNISVGFIQFSKNAVLDFSKIERFNIAQKIESLMLNNLNYKQIPNISLFQSYGEKFITQNNYDLISNLRTNKSNVTYNRKPVIGALSRAKHIWSKFSLENDFFKYVFSDDVPDINSNTKIIDVSTGITDVAFNEDLGHISYLMKQGNFGLYDKEADDWINNYIAIEDKEIRYKLLSDLHYKALINCYIYPVYSKPYVAITTKDWELNQNKFLASTFIWQMRHN